MTLWRRFWRDECGAVISAEMVLIGTVAILGTTVGLKTLSQSINAELTDVARAIRSLDQSYCYCGFSSCRAWTAGSCFMQEPVERSLQSLCVGIEPNAAPATHSTTDESSATGQSANDVQPTAAEEKL